MFSLAFPAVARERKCAKSLCSSVNACALFRLPSRRSSLSWCTRTCVTWSTQHPLRRKTQQAFITWCSLKSGTVSHTDASSYPSVCPLTHRSFDPLILYNHQRYADTWLSHPYVLVRRFIPKPWQFIWSWSPHCCYNSIHLPAIAKRLERCVECK